MATAKKKVKIESLIKPNEEPVAKLMIGDYVFEITQDQLINLNIECSKVLDDMGVNW
jgi:hypothetical protein